MGQKPVSQIDNSKAQRFERRCQSVCDIWDSWDIRLGQNQVLPMEALILVATSGEPTMFARIGVMRALNRGHVREFNPSRKDPHWGRRKLSQNLILE